MRLIYFSPVFARSYAQRPHFTVEACLRAGVDSVLWIEPYPCRLPQWNDLRRRASRDDQGTALDPRIEVLAVPALPIEPLPGGPWLNRHLLWPGVLRRMRSFAAAGPTILGIGRPGALPLFAMDLLRPAGTFYEAMDDFPEFHRGLARRAMRRHEDEIAARADLIIASSSALTEKFARRGLRVETVLNAYPTESLPPYEPQTGGPLVLGYLGCLGKWFDWPLVVRLAGAMPEARLELVGPLAVPPPDELPANIHLLPSCPQSEAGRHLQRFSAGLIPFCRTPLTAGVDPIKYYEYRAYGLPVLSTRFGQMNERGPADGVHFLDAGGDLRETVAQALSRTTTPADVARFRAENDWQARWAASPGLKRLLSHSAATAPQFVRRGLAESRRSKR